MKHTLSGVLAAALLAATQAFADFTVTSVQGDVRADNKAVQKDARLLTGATLSTGAGAMAHLKFDDGQQIVLNEQTTFRVTDFRYRAQEPQSDRAVFDLVRGALRFITGIVGTRNRAAIALRVPQATIGVRGTDFMVSLVNPAYVSVLQGSIAATNSAGTVAFGQGAIGQIASSNALAATIPAASLPAAASSAFANLTAANVAAGAAAAGSGGSAGAATGAAAAPSTGAGAAAALGVGAAIVGTAIKQDESTTHH